MGVIGFDRLNPQLQEKVIPNLLSLRKPHGKPSKHDDGKPGNGHRNRSARPWEK